MACAHGVDVNGVCEDCREVLRKARCSHHTDGRLCSACFGAAFDRERARLNAVRAHAEADRNDVARVEAVRTRGFEDYVLAVAGAHTWEVLDRSHVLGAAAGIAAKVCEVIGCDMADGSCRRCLFPRVIGDCNATRDEVSA